jgi:phosphatidylglycerol---prolipoprotein diacylglyceryl transferase
MQAYFVWDFNPILFHIWGPLKVGLYGIVFVCTLITAFVFWRWQMKRGGFSRDAIEGFIVWGAMATIVGARLGHCIFYSILPDWMDGNLAANEYIRDPVRLLAFWEGGLASHGATIGLVLALWAYARHYRLPVLEVMDRFSPSAAVGSAGIRLGNFLNSEIVGRVTDVPWAVKFVHGEDHGLYPRHPSQIYEFTMGLTVLAILVVIDRKAGREKRPRGLLVGSFFLLYFTGRFLVEFFKEYQTPNHGFLTEGQVLSILPMIIGVVLLVWSLVRRVPTRAEGQPTPGKPQAVAGYEPPAEKPDPDAAAQAKRRRLNRRRQR